MANLPQDMSQVTMSDQKRSFAIAELVIFSAIQIVQFVSRFIQERRYWHHTKRRGNARCFLYSWWGMVGILAQRMNTFQYTGYTGLLLKKIHSSNCRFSHDDFKPEAQQANADC